NLQSEVIAACGVLPGTHNGGGTMRKALLTFVLIVCSIAMGDGSAFGQVASTSSLSGVVADPTGAVIPGVEVVAKNNATNAEFRASTVENGTFAIPVLDSGFYTVSASLPGFKRTVLTNVKLDAGVPSTVRFTLGVGEVTDTVTVAAGAEILQSQTSNIA